MLSADSSKPSSSASTKVTIIVLTAVLYAVGKGITAYIPTPLGVGQLLVGLFIPAFLAVVSDTFPVAVGAGLGTFIGDVLFLVPLNATTPALSLVAGVPANFVAFYLFGWFVKRYKTWSGFVAATVSFVNLGNLISALGVAWYIYYFVPVANLPPIAYGVFDLTVFWDMTAIPAVIIGVPILVRAARSLYGRSRIITHEPSWASSTTTMQTAIALAFAALFVLLGVLFLIYVPTSQQVFNVNPAYYALAAALVVIFAPIASVVAGTRLQAKKPGA